MMLGERIVRIIWYIFAIFCGLSMVLLVLLPYGMGNQPNEPLFVILMLGMTVSIFTLFFDFLIDYLRGDGYD